MLQRLPIAFEHVKAGDKSGYDEYIVMRICLL